jgi:hypothetical protein
MGSRRRAVTMRSGFIWIMLKQLPGSMDFQLPNEVINTAAGSYFSVAIQTAIDAQKVVVDLRKTQRGIEVVGIERTW